MCAIEVHMLKRQEENSAVCCFLSYSWCRLSDMHKREGQGVPESSAGTKNTKNQTIGSNTPLKAKFKCIFHAQKLCFEIGKLG